MVWVVGMVVFLAYQAIRHYRLVKTIRRWGDDVTDGHPFAILQHLKTEMGMSRPIKLCSCPCVGSPMLMGFIKPCILLPHMDLNEGELRFILKHELVHLRRNDLYYKIFVLIAISMHWFNPVAYRMAKEIDTLCSYLATLKPCKT